MKQITITDEMYQHLLDKIHENVYGLGKTALEYAVIKGTIDIEDDNIC